MRQLRRRSVRNPDTVLDILRYLSVGPNIHPTLRPCSFVRCSCPTDPATRRAALEAMASERHLTWHRRDEWIATHERTREVCDRLGFHFVYAGTAAHYCTMSDECPFQAADWRPCPVPMVEAPERMRFAPTRWTLVVIRDVRDALTAACGDAEGLVGAAARAWVNDDWSEVDAFGGEVVAGRMAAQQALAAHIAEQLTARYYPRG